MIITIIITIITSLLRFKDSVVTEKDRVRERKKFDEKMNETEKKLNQNRMRLFSISPNPLIALLLRSRIENRLVLSPLYSDVVDFCLVYCLLISVSSSWNRIEFVLAIWSVCWKKARYTLFEIFSCRSLVFVFAMNWKRTKAISPFGNQPAPISIFIVFAFLRLFFILSSLNFFPIYLSKMFHFQIKIYFLYAFFFFLKTNSSRWMKASVDLFRPLKIIVKF